MTVAELNGSSAQGELAAGDRADREGDSRHAHHGQATKGAIARRLRKIEGQVRGIARMVGQDVYCDEVLNQITAVEAALSGVRRLLLEAHIRGCVVEQIEEGRHEVIGELMKTIGRMTR